MSNIYAPALYNDRAMEWKKDIQYIKFAAYGFLKNLRLYQPFMLLYFLSVGLSYFQIGILYAIREFAVNILEIPTGIIADTYGRKKALLISMGIYILILPLFLFMKSFYFFAWAMFMLGAAEAFRSGTHNAMIMSYLKIHELQHIRKQYYGSVRSWWQIGAAINALLSGLLIVLWGDYKTTFIASTFFMTINFFNILSYPDYIDEKGMKKRSSLSATKEFIWLLTHPQVLRILLNSSVSTGIFRGTKDYLQPILKSVALSIPLMLWLSGKQREAILIGITYFIIYILSSRASKYAYVLDNVFIDRPHIIINGLYILTVTLLILAGLSLHLQMNIMAAFIFILIYITLNLARPFIIDYISDTVAVENMAMALSAETQLTTITSGIIAPIAGKVADTWGIHMALVVAGMVGIMLYPISLVKDKVAYNVSTGGERSG